MARPVFATILPLILIPFLLFQVRNCSSRALPPEDQQPLVLTAPLVAYPDAAETGAQPVAAAIAEDEGQSRASVRADGAAPSSSATAASPRDKVLQAAGGVSGSSWPHRSSLLAGPQPQVLLRSKLARRFLLPGVVEGGDSAARASCHSSDVHNSGCTPPSEH